MSPTRTLTCIGNGRSEGKTIPEWKNTKWSKFISGPPLAFKSVSYKLKKTTPCLQAGQPVPSCVMWWSQRSLYVSPHLIFTDSNQIHCTTIQQHTAMLGQPLLLCKLGTWVFLLQILPWKAISVPLPPCFKDCVTYTQTFRETHTMTKITMEQLSLGLFHWEVGNGETKDSFIIMQLEDIVFVA